VIVSVRGLVIAATLLSIAGFSAADDPFTEVFRAMGVAVRNIGRPSEDLPAALLKVADIRADFDAKNRAVDLFEATTIRELFFIEKVCQPSEEQLDRLYRHARLGVPKMAKRAWDAGNEDSLEDLPNGLGTIRQWMEPAVQNHLTDEQIARWRRETDARHRRWLQANAALIVLRLQDRIWLSNDQLRSVQRAIRRSDDAEPLTAVCSILVNEPYQIPPIEWFEDELTKLQVSIATTFRDQRRSQPQAFLAEMDCFSLNGNFTAIEPCMRRWTRVSNQLRSEKNLDDDPAPDDVADEGIAAIAEEEIVEIGSDEQAIEVLETDDRVAVQAVRPDGPVVALAIAPEREDKRFWSPQMGDNTLTRGANNLNEARRLAEQMLEIRLDDYRGVIGDQPKEITKLRLAGMLDINDFFADYDRFKREHPAGNVSISTYQNHFAEARKFGERFEKGLHGDGSLLQKATGGLDESTVGRLRDWDQSRQRQIHTMHMEIFLALLSSRLGLTSRQHETLWTLIDAEFPPDEFQAEANYARSTQRLAEIDRDVLADVLSPTEIDVFRTVAEYKLPSGLTGEAF